MNEYAHKLSPSTKRLLIQAEEGENPELSLLIRVEFDHEDEQRVLLESQVVEVRSIAGDIITVTAYMQAVPNLAALEFVKYIEVSGPLYPETTPSTP
jgi:hypothetical protein